MTNPTIGDRIRKIRKDNNLSQNDFGKILGVTQTHISKIEKNQDNPSLTLIKFICAKYNVNEEWLINGVGLKVKQTGVNSEGVQKVIELCFTNLKNSLASRSAEIQWEYEQAFDSFVTILSVLDSKFFESEEDFIDYYKVLSRILDNIKSLSYLKSTKSMYDDDYIDIKKQSILQKIKDDINLL